MKSPKDFEEFLKRGIVKRQSPDKSRARFLAEESEKNHSLFNLPTK